MFSDCIPCLLPQPKSIRPLDGVFEIDVHTSISLEAGTSYADVITANRLKCGLLEATGYDLPVTRAEHDCRAHDFILRIVPDGMNAESYRIHIAGDCVCVEGASSAGLRYGVETLLQIVNQFGIDLSAMEIEDAPDFAVRGFYHDVTRGQVPTLSTLKHIADSCVAYKINHLQLYIEHSFLFQSMREIGAGMDPLTAVEILELDRYCRERHIDLVPSISTFGHMYEVLRTRSFQHLNELPIEAGNLPYNWYDRHLHYTLDVNDPESIKLVERMFDEFLPLFSSDFVNICCDETFDLGKGKNSNARPKDLYIKHLTAVVDLVRARGKRAMFWGDMVLEYGELLATLPKDIVVLNWHYGTVPPTPPEANAARFEAAGLTQYVCPGVHVWESFAAKIQDAESNIGHMAMYGKKYHASGLLNTNWGDHGHMNLLSASMHGLIMGASYSWNVEGTPVQSDFDTAFSTVAYGDSSRRLGDLLRRLGDADPYRYLTMDDKPVDELRKDLQSSPDLDVETLRQHLDTASEISRELAHLRVSARAGVRMDYDEFIWSASMICAANRYALLLLGEGIQAREALACEFERLYDEYAGLWRRRSKESELFRIREAMLRTALRIRDLCTPSCKSTSTDLLGCQK